MKTIQKLFLIATIALGLGFVACNDTDDVSSVVDESKPNTHMSVTLKLSSNVPTRALSDDYNAVGTWAGRDKVETITVYLVDESPSPATVTAKTFKVGNGGNDDYTFDTSTGMLVPKGISAAFRTTSGNKKVYVVINETAKIKSLLATANAETFITSYVAALSLENSGNDTSVSTSASKLATLNSSSDETIVMTNDVTPMSVNLTEGVTAAQATATSSPINRIALNVERTVARVMVTKKEGDSFDVIRSGTTDEKIGTISELTWSIAQGENQLYLQRKETWNTPSFNYVATDADYSNEAADKYDYSGLFEATDVPPLNAYIALNATPDNQIGVLSSLSLTTNAVKGKFLLPNTHEYGAQIASSYRKGNTAYVLIRTKFTPTVFADNVSYSSGSDFYVGANGKFYTSAVNAITPVNGGVTGQTVAKYVGGKVLYYAWLNPDAIPAWYNSPVLRNNIYHIHITGFKNLGTNWNPLFPGEGNPDPKPEGDLEPVNPIKPGDHLTMPETWMSVDVNVLPWKVHSYSVDLGI